MRAIISLGIGLGITITAEGVETEAELSCLRAEGCHEGPGLPVQPRPAQRRDRGAAEGAARFGIRRAGRSGRGSRAGGVSCSSSFSPCGRRSILRANHFCLSEIVSSPPCKNKSLNTSGKSLLQIRPSHPTRGVAHVTNARWDAMDATASGAQGIAGRIALRERSSGARTNGAANCLRWNSLGCVRGPARALARQARTVKSCGPDAPCWRQAVRRCIRAQPGSNASSIRKATVAKVLGSPRRARISRNPSCRESRMIRFTCGLLVRSLCARPRVQSAPGFPCALFSREGETDANLGRIAPRECGRVSALIETHRHCRSERRSNPASRLSLHKSWIASLRSQ